MAIDSATRRASVLGVSFVALALIVPDGTIDQGDRQTISHQYSGILAGVATLPPLIDPKERQIYMVSAEDRVMMITDDKVYEIG